MVPKTVKNYPCSFNSFFGSGINVALLYRMSNIFVHYINTITIFNSTIFNSGLLLRLLYLFFLMFSG